MGPEHRLIKTLINYLIKIVEGKKSGELEEKGSSKFFSSAYWKTARNRLKKDTAGKCGFCETPTSAAYYGDVEHFRPKSPNAYWWLAYCFDNYLYSCRLCNGKKSDDFVITGTPLPEPSLAANVTARALAAALCPEPLDADAVQAFTAACLAEDAGLPFPYHENPERFFAWRADETVAEVEVISRHHAYQHRFEAVVELLDLNRDDLRSQRFVTYEPLKGFRDIYLAGDNQVKTIAETELRKMMQADRPYAAMCRYFVNAKWKLEFSLDA